MEYVKEGASYGITSYQIPENKIELDTEFFKLALPQTPILNAISRGQPIQSTKIEWWDDNPTPFEFELIANHVGPKVGENSTTQLGDGELVIGTQANLVKVGNILKYKDLYFRVTEFTTVGANQAVKVDVVSGTDVDIAAGQKIQLVSDAMPEGADWSTTGIVTATKRFNVTQIFTDGIRFTNTEMNVAPEYNLQLVRDKIAEKLTKMRILLDRTILNGVLYDATNNTKPRMMGGILYYVKQNGILSTGNFKEENFQAFLEQLYYARQEEPITDVWMHPKSKQTYFDPLLAEKRWLNIADTRAGQMIDTYVSEWGNVRLNTASQLPVDVILAFDPNKAKLIPFRPFTMQEVPVAGDYRFFSIVGEYTMEVRDSALAGLWTITAQ